MRNTIKRQFYCQNLVIVVWVHVSKSILDHDMRSPHDTLNHAMSCVFLLTWMPYAISISSTSSTSKCTSKYSFQTNWYSEQTFTQVIQPVQYTVHNKNSIGKIGMWKNNENCQTLCIFWIPQTPNPSYQQQQLSRKCELSDDRIYFYSCLLHIRSASKTMKYSNSAIIIFGNEKKTATEFDCD